MAETSEILLFGDQTDDYRSTLQQVFRVDNNPLLTTFLHECAAVLRTEISQQPRFRQTLYPGFTSVVDLIARYPDPNDTRLNSLESALTCISQLACFFNHQAAHGGGYPSPSTTRIVGSCIGLLSGAAVSSATSLLSLLSIALTAVRVAFRIGLVVAKTGDALYQPSSVSSSWSAVVSGLSEEDAIDSLDRFHRANATPLAKKAYVSAIGPAAITISGAPPTLEQLLGFDKVKDCKTVRVPIHGPFHADHLYGECELESPFSPEIAQNVLHLKPSIPVLSTGTKRWLAPLTFKELLQDVTADILKNQLLWNGVVENVLSTIKESGFSQCKVVRMGPSKAVQSLVSALKQRAELAVSVEDSDFPLSETSRINRSTVSALASSKIAICGLSGRFPDSADHEAFWNLLEQGLDLHREIPKDRFNVETHVDVDGKKTNTMHTPFGCFIEQPGLFDARFFNISPREAAQIDPMQRLALVTAYEALEMAGFVQNRTLSSRLDRVGTFYGQTSDDWREIQAAQKVDTYFIPGNVRAFSGGRINFLFNFSGPSFNIDTACSSSLAAINIACNSLWAGDCDTAIAGGVNVLTNPDIFSGLSRGQFLSKKGPCATFDNDADGYCRADAVGSVVLKRLEDARADKDPILGVILGAGTNHSAEAVSITHPHAGAQEFLYKKVLTSANVDPHDISYVEMHGTGTQAGDAIEMQSVTNTFAPEHRRRRQDQSLHLGSVKANAGHAEAASGITSLIKVLMMMEKNLIPPHCGIKGSINRTFPQNLPDRNVHIAFKPKPWSRPDAGKRRVFLNNFSAAGGNTALILEDGPMSPAPAKADPRPIHVIAITARSSISLKRNLTSLAQYLAQNPGVNLPSLSYTTTARKMQHNHRVTIAGSEISKIRETLSSHAGHDVSPLTAKPKIAFVFTGQGCHYASMGKHVFDISELFRSHIKRFDSIARQQGFASILPLVDGSVDDVQTLGPVVVQVGAICVQMALSRLLRAWNIHPSVVLGHSLGEYAALNAAGVLSASDTIYLVGLRAKLLEAKCCAGSHAMLAVKASAASISQYLEGSNLEIACVNGPEETVLSGTNIDVEILAGELGEQGFKSTKLSVPYAFHSAQVNPVLEEFEDAARGATYSNPLVPVISPLLKEVIANNQTFGPSYLRRHCRETVNFLSGIESAKHEKAVSDDTLWIEIGCHPLCSGMIKATLGSKARTVALMRRNEDDWKSLVNAVCFLHDAGVDVDWASYHFEYESSLTNLRLPTYQWDNRNYWIDYTYDWTLAKGNPHVAAEVASRKPQLSAASIHSIISATFGDSPTVVAESDLTDPLVKECIEGHEVNGIGLTPPSLYADMSLTVADFMLNEMSQKKPDFALNCCEMKVEKPLIVDESRSSQMLRIAGRMDNGIFRFDFYSVNGDGKKSITHATCGVKYEDKTKWTVAWDRATYLVKPRIDSLLAGVANGSNDLIKRAMAYKLFGGLIHYGHKYRGMEEVVLDNEQLEATSSVVFQTGGTDETFLCSPYRIDSVAHLSGFIMLGNATADTSKEVYVSHGWTDCRIAKPLKIDRKYRAYVKMHKESAKMVVGDVYVFDQEDDEIIAVVESLRFHGLPRQLMDSILASANPNVKTSKPIGSKSDQAKVETETLPKKKAPAPAPAAAPAPKASKGISGGLTKRAVAILAAEIGVPESDLHKGAAFTEFGVDSLLSLTISGKFREDLGIEVPSSLFVDCPDVGRLEAFLAEQQTDDGESRADEETASATESQSTASSEEATTPSSLTSEASQPLDCQTDVEVKIVRSTVAGELGVGADEISSSTNLANLGMDSLMSLSVLGKIREVTGKELPSDFLEEKSTFEDIENGLGMNLEPEPPKKVGFHKSKSPTASNTQEAEVADSLKSDECIEPMEPSTFSPKATSILLHGNPQTATKKLFLFPDGSGSATSYVFLPLIDPDVAMYGLNSPFMKDSASYTTGIPGLVKSYVAEILERQPQGSYSLGGWSAGGVCAYEAVLQLHSHGRHVERLMLLDTPSPYDLAILPPNLHSFFDEIGLLGPTGNQGGTPDWLLPHFDASVKNLSLYKPEAIKDAEAPKTFALWASDGVCKFESDLRPHTEKMSEEPASMKWLLNNRSPTQLKFNGWDRLLGKDAIVETRVVENANHFTMMREDRSKEIGRFLTFGMLS